MVDVLRWEKEFLQFAAAKKAEAVELIAKSKMDNPEHCAKIDELLGVARFQQSFKPSTT